MFQRGIRGATTVEIDTPEEISGATVELLNKILLDNKVNTEDISHVIFTMTGDLKSVYPAKFARENIEGFNRVPMVCFQELSIENSMKKCIRVLMVINTEVLEQKDIKHIYLREAKKLREDLSNA
ncbi:chorismate mutase [bacterium]|nr:chorismate mutase [bacterium]